MRTNPTRHTSFCTSFEGAPVAPGPSTPEEYSDVHCSVLRGEPGQRLFLSLDRNRLDLAKTPLTPTVHNIPIPSSPSSPHPLATVSSSGAPFSGTALPPLVVPPPISADAGCSEGAGFDKFGGPGAGVYHEASICPTVGRFVPLAYPCSDPG